MVDNLNTHWSIDVCRLVAQWCTVPCVAQDLRRGVQRRAFLSDPTPKHVFHFTPQHGSWLNQVERWCSVVARRFLKRGDFASAHDCETRLFDYLEVYNTHHAHPYRWTYTGQPWVRATPFSRTRRQQRQGRAWFSSRPKCFERGLYPPGLTNGLLPNWQRTYEMGICNTLRTLYAQGHGQQDTWRCDDGSAARRDLPALSLSPPAVPGSPLGSGHPDTHRARTGST